MVSLQKTWQAYWKWKDGFQAKDADAVTTAGQINATNLLIHKIKALSTSIAMLFPS